MCNICAHYNPFSSDCVYSKGTLDAVMSETSDSSTSTSYTTSEWGGFDETPYTQVITLDATVNESSDAPLSLSTPYTIEPGDTFNGSISTPSDVDVVAIDIQPGETITLVMTRTSGTMEPTTYITTDTGQIISYETDFTATTSTIEITYSGDVPTTIYWVGYDYENNQTGNYSLTVSSTPAAPLPTFTNDEIADYISEFNPGGPTYTWNVDPSDPNNSITVNITALTADGQALARAALEAWTMATGINFTEVSSGGAMVFDDNQAGAFAGPTSVSGTTINSATVNVSTNWLATYGTTIDSYSFQTYIHEIGHALGLGHAGNYDGVAVYDFSNVFTNDSWQATVMSYFDQTQNPTTDADYALVISPMIADILAIQDMYGVAGDIRTGNTVYGVGSTAGGYYDDILGLDTAPVAFTILDDGGIDTFDFSTDTEDQVVDLNDETYSSIYGVEGNLAIMRGTIIENYVAGSGNDSIIGNEADNIITGNAGNDTIDGGAGSDTVVFADDVFANVTVTIDGASATISGTSGTDVITNVEFVEFDDQIVAFDDLLAEPIPNTAPVIDVADQTVNANEVTALSDVLIFNDADGDTAQQYQLWDSSGANNWSVDGTPVNGGSFIGSDLSSITFVGDPAASSQPLWLRVFDGTDWSDWESFTLTTVA